MKPIIFMFYYLNVEGMSRSAVEEILYRTIKLTKVENTDFEIIQQYFPTTNQATRVDVVTVPEIKIENNDLALKIHKNIEKIIGHYEQFSPIETIEDLYDG